MMTQAIFGDGGRPSRSPGTGVWLDEAWRSRFVWLLMRAGRLRSRQIIWRMGTLQPSVTVKQRALF